MRTNVRVAVIGGGVTGASVLYHLARAGWTEAALFERSELTAGSTWHAAGGVGALLGHLNMAYLHYYTFQLYPELERETGQSCGFHPVGGLVLARTRHRLEDLKILRSKVRRLGIEAEFLSNEEALRRAPILDLRTALGVLHDPTRAHVDPSSVTQAFAKGARDRGAEIHRHCPVLATRPVAGGWDIVTEKGTVRAEHVVNAAGLWAREVAALVGFRLPLMPVEHHYFVTEAIPEIERLDHELPLIGDADAEFYMRQEGKGLLLGAYEDRCTHWAVEGTPADFGHELLGDDLDRIERNLAQAIECVPVLGRAGVKRVINGPMIFSPDLNPLIGPYPGLTNYWCACGVMTAFSQAGAIGKVLADWMTEGDPGLDVTMWDVTRYGPWAGKAYTRARTADMYATRFKTVFPYEERPAGRPVRTTPAYVLLREKGAVFGSADGWEQALWYAPEGIEPRDELTFHRPNWFGPVGEECRALRNGVGLIEISTYGKHAVRGPGAAAFLERVLANRLPAREGRTVLAPMLSERGRLVGDFTVTRLGPEEFFVVGSGAAERFHRRWWDRFQPAGGEVSIESLTARLTGLHIAGPRSRELLSRLTDADLGNGAFPFLCARRLEVGPATDVLVIRISFTGELGYELYCPPEQQLPLLEALLVEGRDLGLRLCGGRALGALRLEKGYPSWGRELSPDYTPFEAGLDRFVKLDKPDFVGRDAALRLKQQTPAYRLATLVIDADDADPWGGEPVMAGDRVVGYVTTGGFGHTVGASLALAYLRADLEPEAALGVEVIGELRPVRIAPEPLVDPRGERLRS